MTSAQPHDWVAISAEALSLDVLDAWARRPDCGAVVSFCGTARTTSTIHHDIVALEYETDSGLAEARMRSVVAEARTRWPDIGAVALHHRVGRVALMESAVVVVVSAPHRESAFDAARFCIDALKRSVPMWKREIWEGGSQWSDAAQGIVHAREV